MGVKSRTGLDNTDTEVTMLLDEAAGEHLKLRDHQVWVDIVSGVPSSGSVTIDLIGAVEPGSGATEPEEPVNGTIDMTAGGGVLRFAAAVKGLKIKQSGLNAGVEWAVHWTPAE